MVTTSSVKRFSLMAMKSPKSATKEAKEQEPEGKPKKGKKAREADRPPEADGNAESSSKGEAVRGSIQGSANKGTSKSKAQTGKGKQLEAQPHNDGGGRGGGGDDHGDGRGGGTKEKTKVKPVNTKMMMMSPRSNSAAASARHDDKDDEGVVMGNDRVRQPAVDSPSPSSRSKNIRAAITSAVSGKPRRPVMSATTTPSPSAKTATTTTTAAPFSGNGINREIKSATWNGSSSGGGGGGDYNATGVQSTRAGILSNDDASSGGSSVTSSDDDRDAPGEQLEQDEEAEGPGVELRCGMCNLPYQEPNPPCYSEELLMDRPDPAYMNIPKILPGCLHVFCQSCLEDAYQRAMQQAWQERARTTNATSSNQNENDDDEHRNATTRLNSDHPIMLTCSSPGCGEQSQLQVHGGVGALITDHRTCLQVRIWRAALMWQECGLCEESVRGRYRCLDCCIALCSLHARAHGRSRVTLMHQVVTLKDFKNIREQTLSFGSSSSYNGGGGGGGEGWLSPDDERIAAVKEKAIMIRTSRKRLKGHKNHRRDGGSNSNNNDGDGGDNGDGGRDGDDDVRITSRRRPQQRRRKSSMTSLMSTSAMLAVAAARKERWDTAIRLATRKVPLACGAHPQLEAKLSCRQCNALVCHHCVTAGEHAGHYCEEARNVEAGLQADMLNDMREAEASLAGIEDSASQVRERLRMVRRRQEKIALQVEHTFESVRAALDQQERVLFARLDSICGSKVTELENQLAAMEDAHSKLASALRSTQHILSGAPLAEDSTAMDRSVTSVTPTNPARGLKIAAVRDVGGGGPGGGGVSLRPHSTSTSPRFTPRSKHGMNNSNYHHHHQIGQQSGQPAEVMMPLHSEEFTDVQPVLSSALQTLRGRADTLIQPPIEDDQVSFYCDASHLEMMAKQVSKVGAFHTSRDAFMAPSEQEAGTGSTSPYSNNQYQQQRQSNDEDNDGSFEYGAGDDDDDDDSAGDDDDASENYGDDGAGGGGGGGRDGYTGYRDDDGGDIAERLHQQQQKEQKAKLKSKLSTKERANGRNKASVGTVPAIHFSLQQLRKGAGRPKGTSDNPDPQTSTATSTSTYPVGALFEEGEASDGGPYSSVSSHGSRYIGTRGGGDGSGGDGGGAGYSFSYRHADADDIVVEVRGGSDSSVILGKNQHPHSSNNHHPNQGHDHHSPPPPLPQRHHPLQSEYGDGRLLGRIHLRVRLEGKGLAFEEEQLFEAVDGGGGGGGSSSRIPGVRLTKVLRLVSG